MEKSFYSNLSLVFLVFLFASCDKESENDTSTVTPIANFTFQYVNPMKIQFNNTSTNAISYSWNFGDGNPQIIQDLTTTHRYLLPGTYNVVLTANTISQSDTHTEQITIEHTKCRITGLNIEYIDLINSNMDLYYTMSIQNGNFLQSSIKNWNSTLPNPISNYYSWSFPNLSGQFTQYLDEMSTIKIYWTTQVPTSLLQEIQFNPLDYTQGANAYPSFINLEKYFNGNLVLRLKIFVLWD